MPSVLGCISNLYCNLDIAQNRTFSQDLQTTLFTADPAMEQQKTGDEQTTSDGVARVDSWWSVCSVHVCPMYQHSLTGIEIITVIYINLYF